MKLLNQQFLKVIFILLLISVLNSLCFSEIIHLNDGSIIKGEIVKQDEGGIIIRTKMGLLTVLKKDILRIEYSEVSAQESNNEEVNAPVTKPVQKFRSNNDNILRENKSDF